eukprot:g19096.t1
MGMDEFTLAPEELQVYKVLGTEESLLEYNAHASRFARPPDWNDWKAMYTQFDLEHTLGTVPYRWEQQNQEGEDYTHANLVKVSFAKPLPVVLASGPAFWDAALPGRRKAELVKEALSLKMEELKTARNRSVNRSEPLMVELGRQQKALLMQETEAEWELIFSHEHLAALEQHSELVCTFHRSSQWPITATWQRPGDEPQKYVDDGQLLRALETRVTTFRPAPRLTSPGLRVARSTERGTATQSCGHQRRLRNGVYDMQQLRPCLEALGLRIHDEEWMEVERIFMPVAKKPQKKTFAKSVTKVLFEEKMRKVKGPEKSPVHASDMSDFDIFQKSFFTVQEFEYHLTTEQIEEFRADLVPLDFLFRRFDRHGQRLLSEKEVLNLLERPLPRWFLGTSQDPSRQEKIQAYEAAQAGRAGQEAGLPPHLEKDRGRPRKLTSEEVDTTQSLESQMRQVYESQEQEVVGTSHEGALLLEGLHQLGYQHCVYSPGFYSSSLVQEIQRKH